jgi:thiol-disulfide isomerase/thioredoxin
MKQGFRWLFLVWLVALPLAVGNAAPTTNVVVAPHAGELVALQDDQLVPFKSGKYLEAPYIVLYFSAGWCPDCRRFSPTLVAAYDRQPTKQFEVLLLSRDKSQADMLKYMRTDKMKWPALAFDKLGEAQDLKKYFSSKGIPCLSVIDPEGKVVLQSKSDQDAAEVLRELEELIKKGA